MTDAAAASMPAAGPAESLFLAHRQDVFRRVDGLFARIMGLQWLAAIAGAVWIAPRTWEGPESSIHPHIWAAVIVGTLVTVFPVGLALARPGEVLTRHVVAVGQMLMSALLIHITGGRIETHFHVFGSLAFLAFYRDWKVLVSASVVVALDHFVRGIYYPESVFGVVTASPWRWMEHAAWVVFEDAFLIAACARGVREMREIAERTADLQSERDRFEAGVEERTAQLKKEEEQFRRMAETSADGLVIADAAGNITFWNRGAERIFGRSVEEAVGQPLTILMPERYQGAHSAGLERFLSTGEPRVLGKTVELHGRRKDGSEFPIELSLAHWGNGDGGRFGAILRDITERRRTEEQMREAMQSAEAASRAKADFLANMSHEIRTPMNGVIGMTGLLLDTKMGAEQREYAETIRSSADHLLTLVNDILDFSKLEAGQMSIEPIPFDLQVAVEEVADLLSPKAEEKGIELIVRYPPEGPRRFVGDPGRIRQVLVNLAGNAVKFTREGHVLVDVEIRGAGPGPAPVRISVKDTGIGISPEVQKNLFRKFAQADASTTRRFGGTGLGLAISKHIVELMGGAVGVVSEPDRGSSFWFEVPLPLDSEAGPAAPAGNGDLSVLGGLRVLVVDDNEVNRKVLLERCANWGMDCHAESGGATGLAALLRAKREGRPFALALIDHFMPDMDGEALTLAVRANPAIRDTPLLMLTSAPRRGDAARLRECGITAYFGKPIHAADLADAMALVWSRRGSGRGDIVTQHTLAEIRSSRRAAAAARTADGPAPAERPFPCRILLVEDNVVNQKVAVRLLEKFGCRVDVAANGREAVQMVVRLPYDLVFMDCQMPEMDGYEATAAIRAMGNGKGRVPIVAMTADVMKGTRQRCLDAGMDGYVTKPVLPEEVRAALAAHVPPKDPAVPAPEFRPAVDLDALSTNTGGDRALEAAVAAAFLDEERGMRKAIRDAAEAGNLHALCRAAHRFRGSLLTLGVTTAAELALVLESLGDIAGAVDIVRELETELDRARDTLSGIAAGEGRG